MEASTETRLEEVPGVGRAEAWRLAAAENEAFLALLRDVRADEAGAPTACAPWTVRDVAAHILGWAEAVSSPREFLRQGRAALGRRRAYDGNIIHAQNAVQVEQAADQPLDTIVARLEVALPRLLKARKALAVVGAPLPMSNPLFGFTTVAFVMRMIFTRDIAMHRSDIAVATGRAFMVAPETRRVFEDCLRHWAARARPDVRLDLTGDLGGRYVAGGGAASVRGDGHTFFRLLGGRGAVEDLEVDGDVAAVRAWIAVGCPF